MDDAPYLWQRYQAHYCEAGGLGLDISRMHFPDDFFAEHAEDIRRAFDEMTALENGAMANPDEGRRVGHYWLRNPALAPAAEARLIREAQDAIARFARDTVRLATEKSARRFVRGEKQRFDRMLLIGIGGSALGTQFLADALAGPDDPLQPFFFDNTDPDGMDRVLRRLRAHEGGLDRTLAIVVSKSGTTPETRNGMLEAMQAYKNDGVGFADHAVAVTREGSDLHQASQGWLAQFPMWDWVGGRTSVTSAVGLLPATLQGIATAELLAGAAEMDVATRTRSVPRNPAMLLALMWLHAGDGRGEKAMVILPYSDRLLLFSRVLQQLVMESLGKERDLAGRLVHQGLTVYGNKGSTDQHAFVQQLRDGRNDFFATFIRVLRGRQGTPVNLLELDETTDAEGCRTSDDYLDGFLLGTRQALADSQRESITLTLAQVDARNVGRLIALFERAVGLYASLIRINAYDQPGVEAGKKAAGHVLDLQARALRHLEAHSGHPFTPAQLAEALGQPHKVETLFHILRRLAATGRVEHRPGPRPFQGAYWL